ncbi:MAG: hypothetical protein P0S95_00220 [Rhabdochlamydiaceae bacterium]|nr:hypothetical protein [Candidatus Amphrikana amoebophyrae]
MSIVAFDVDDCLNWLFPIPKESPPPFLSVKQLALVALVAIASLFNTPYARITLFICVHYIAIKKAICSLFTPHRYDPHIISAFTAIFSALKQRRLTHIIRFSFDSRTIAAMIPTLNGSSPKVLLGKFKIKKRTIPFILFKLNIRNQAPFQIMLTESAANPNQLEIRFYSIGQRHHIPEKFAKKHFPSFKDPILHFYAYQDPYNQPFALLGTRYGSQSINEVIIKNLCDIIKA